MRLAIVNNFASYSTQNILTYVNPSKPVTEFGLIQDITHEISLSCLKQRTIILLTRHEQCVKFGESFWLLLTDEKLRNTK
jgi:hypothetical protein